MKNLKPSISHRRGISIIITLLVMFTVVCGWLAWVNARKDTPTPPAVTALTPADNLPGTPFFQIKGEIVEFRIVGGAVDESSAENSTEAVTVYGVRKGEEDKGHNRVVILDFTTINPDGVTTVWAKQAVISGPGPTSSIWLRVNKRN